MSFIKKTKIMVFGTFDILHKGHLNFFKQARKFSQNPYLIVSVGRDANVKKIKGKLPQNSEKSRAKQVKKSKLAEKVILGSKSNYLFNILKEKPEIIVLGYDQTTYTKNLKSLLAKKGLGVKIKRLKAYKPNIYKTSLMRK
jgi:FAD synthetase